MTECTERICGIHVYNTLHQYYNCMMDRPSRFKQHHERSVRVSALQYVFLMLWDS